MFLETEHCWETELYESISTWKMALKRPFIGNTWKVSAHSLLGLLEDRAYQVYLIVLLEKAKCWWHWERLCTFVVQVSWEINLIELVCWPCKDWFWKMLILGGCGGPEITGFLQFPLWDSVVVLKGIIFNNFHFGRVLWYYKDWFGQFSLWERMMVLKE